MNSEDDILNFITKTQSEIIPKDGLQYRLYFVKDFKSNESVIIFKVCHSITDGNSFI
jgi:hypothetical protein